MDDVRPYAGRKRELEHGRVRHRLRRRRAALGVALRPCPPFGLQARDVAVDDALVLVVEDDREARLGDGGEDLGQLPHVGAGEIAPGGIRRARP